MRGHSGYSSHAANSSSFALMRLALRQFVEKDWECASSTKHVMLLWRLGRLVAVAMVMLLVSSCGWRPMYGNFASTVREGELVPSDVRGFFLAVDVDLIEHREGQLLRRYLRDNLHKGLEPVKPKLILHVRPDFRIEARGHELSLSVQNTVVFLRARFWLSRADSGEILPWSESEDQLAQGIFFSFDDFAEIYAQRETRRQLTETLARRIWVKMLYWRQLYPDVFAVLSDDRSPYDDLPGPPLSPDFLDLEQTNAHHETRSYVTASPVALLSDLSGIVDLARNQRAIASTTRGVNSTNLSNAKKKR